MFKSNWCDECQFLASTSRQKGSLTSILTQFVSFEVSLDVFLLCQYSGDSRKVQFKDPANRLPIEEESQNPFNETSNSSRNSRNSPLKSKRRSLEAEKRYGAAGIKIEKNK
jgi:hypothetical protein